MSSSTFVYDSAQRRVPFAEFRHFWQYRGLIRLLVSRDLTLRYKRSVLGVWWTLLNPMLTIGVLWMVFSRLFSRGPGEVPFIVYLTAGVLLATFFSQGVIAAGSGIVGNRGILAKVFVPPEVFSVAAALAGAVNFLISMVPLVLILLVSGVPVPWTFALTPLSVLAMLMLVTGAGLLVASVAVVFYDVFDLVRVLTLLIMYLSATFYPIEIVPPGLLWVLEANPVYHHLVFFRGLVYGGPVSWFDAGMVVGSSLGILALGVWVFSRNWRNVVISL